MSESTNDLNETYEETMEESAVITVPIDDTLSNSGEAADAAAVGAALALKADAAIVVNGHQDAEGSDHIGGRENRRGHSAFSGHRSADDPAGDPAGRNSKRDDNPNGGGQPDHGSPKDQRHG